MIEQAVQAERERCAEIALGLAGKWRASAARLRVARSYKTLFRQRVVVAPAAERDARIIDSAARGLEVVADLITSGAIKP